VCMYLFICVSGSAVNNLVLIFLKAVWVPVQILNVCPGTHSIITIIFSVAISTQKLPNH